MPKIISNFPEETYYEITFKFYFADSKEAL